MSGIKIAGIAVDEWKLAIFDKHLTKDGYDYTNTLGIPDVIVLKVPVPEGRAQALAQTVLRANTEASKVKR